MTQVVSELDKLKQFATQTFFADFNVKYYRFFKRKQNCRYCLFTIIFGGSCLATFFYTNNTLSSKHCLLFKTFAVHAGKP